MIGSKNSRNNLEPEFNYLTNLSKWLVNNFRANIVAKGRLMT